jgi:glucose dehydrogenase
MYIKGKQIFQLQYFKLCLFLTCVTLVACGENYSANSDDWALYGNGYHNQRHSSINTINTANIDKLDLAWKYKTGKFGSFQTSPIVLDGVMVFSTAFNDVVAVDATNGSELWRYTHDLRTQKSCCGSANRGVAVSQGKVFQATIDGRLIALDLASGKQLWDIAVKDMAVNIQETLKDALNLDLNQGEVNVIGGTGHSFNMAPQVYENMVLIGSTGAGYGLHLNTKHGLAVVGLGDSRTGLRGFIAAYDITTGEELWRWYTIKDEQWVGDWVETTEDGVSLNRDITSEKEQQKRFPNAWKLGGGSIWTTPAIDTETGWIFFGTGNPAPNMDDSTRPGDNLNTASVVALDSKTGLIQWAYQQVPHDRWGYDVASPPVLFDVEYQGETVKAVGQAGKTGWFYVFNRATGKLLYKSDAFVPQHNMFASPTAEGVKISPAIAGGSNWSPVAVNPHSKTVFIAGIHLPAIYYKQETEPTPDAPWESYSYFTFDRSESYGLLSAIDLNSGRLRWQHKTIEPLIGGVLHTAGGLVFSGRGNGEFFALDENSGKKLWSYQAAYGVNAPPITYRIAGKQYVAVAAGGNKVAGYPVGDELLVFALPDK